MSSQADWAQTAQSPRWIYTITTLNSPYEIIHTPTHAHTCSTHTSRSAWERGDLHMELISRNHPELMAICEAFSPAWSYFKRKTLLIRTIAEPWRATVFATVFEFYENTGHCHRNWPPPNNVRTKSTIVRAIIMRCLTPRCTSVWLVIGSTNYIHSTEIMMSCRNILSAHITNANTLQRK